MLFRHELAVRITDLNYGNHLGHDTLVSLLHEARAAFFRHLGFEEWDTEGCALVVVDLVVSYRAEARFGQVLEVAIGLGDVGSRSCELLYRVTDRNRGTVVALAMTGVVFLDPSTHRVVTIPAAFKQALGRGGTAGGPEA